jgi:hypothetical protein
MAAIIAAGTKLPLCMMTIGKTALAERSHFGHLGYHCIAHFESGWQTAETFAEWFGWLRSLCDDGERLWLILDGDFVQGQEAIRGYGEDPIPGSYLQL